MYFLCGSTTLSRSIDSVRPNPLFTELRGCHIVVPSRDFGQDHSKPRCADSQIVFQGCGNMRESRLVHVLTINSSRSLVFELSHQTLCKAWSPAVCLPRYCRLDPSAHPWLAESRESLPIEFPDVLPSSSDLANVNGLLIRCGFAEILREAIERYSCTEIR